MLKTYIKLKKKEKKEKKKKEECGCQELPKGYMGSEFDSDFMGMMTGFE